MPDEPKIIPPSPSQNKKLLLLFLILFGITVALFTLWFFTLGQEPKSVIPTITN